MKTSIPKLRSIRPKFTDEGAAKHMREGVIHLLANKERPIVGYAIVAIHKPIDAKPLSYGYTATWHCSDTSIDHSDLPDIVRNKLNLEVSIQAQSRS